MLKPALAGVCICVAALATAAHARELSGPQITSLVAGATVEIDTPTGTKLPIRYAQEGKVSGEARELAWYLGAAVDTGQWWVAGDQLCHKWTRWFNSEPQCMRLSRDGRAIRWHSQDGRSGTATIAAAPVAQASALSGLGSAFSRRFIKAPAAEVPPPAPLGPPPKQGPAEPAAEARPAPPPPDKATVTQEPAVPAPAAPAIVAPPPQPAERKAEPKSAPAPPPAPAAKKAEPRQPPPPLFRVANVRDDDVLNVRSGPSADFDIVGELPPDSRGIAIVSECLSRWCPVQHHTTAGWVNSVYLAPEVMPAALHRPAEPPPAKGDSAEAPRACLTPAVHALLDRVEQRFGPVQVVSTCRPGAFIAGSARLSRHASGNAVDFRAGARTAAILEWLIANHRTGGIMTYPGMDHIHVDIGPHFISIAGGPHWSSWSRGP